MFRNSCWILWTNAVLATSICSNLSADDIPGIGPVSQPERLHTNFAFTEGPAADAHGNLYFTDIPNTRIHKRDTKGTLTVFAEPSGHCNGLMVVGDHLYACAMDGQLKQYNPDTAEFKVLADQFQGSRFNAPNDLVMDKTGGIYFTDPRYRAPDPWPQGIEAVYYRAADGKVTRLIDDRTAPNGIILSPDEKWLYIVPSMEEELWVYPVKSAGKIGTGRVLAKMTQQEGMSLTGGDGLTVDTKGNIYVTTGLGLQIFSPAGKQLGIISIPEHPANVTFGGPGLHTLFVTARMSLYAVETKATGHVFRGPPKTLSLK
ncbi:MAG: SMP-30/gluconolactonase/LRE family protein [Fuerstiella sp.]